MADDLDLRALAGELHRSYDWTARNWRSLVRLHGLPAPFIGGQRGGHAWWLRAEVEAWKRGAGIDGPRGVTAANDRTRVYRAVDDAQARLLKAAG